jgi:hypothetical protein
MIGQEVDRRLENFRSNTSSGFKIRRRDGWKWTRAEGGISKSGQDQGVKKETV